ncbi:MAG TPA: response regulator transcription factor [Candidatus Polarisedimenticolia bacterium]|jgi:DNA-binding NarL/FixJ family response regulator|nr:response regulator transcription factor [Candidatus Polarisedimenticolia bacterium]
MPLRVLLADDHPMFVQGLRGILEREKLEVVGEAADGRAAVRVAEKVHPDVAVLDLAMPLLNGIDAAREIKSVSPDTVTILLTSYSEEQYVIDALRAGISGYLLKTRAAEDLVRAIREVSRGSLYLSPGVSRDVLRAHLDGATAPSDPLSAREREVLQLIAEGKSMKEIAALLCISVKTVETHRMRLTGKLEIHDTASLVRYAIRRGMIRP